jgi:hypothetical protein
MTDEWIIEPWATHRSIPTVVISATSASAASSEIDRYGVKQQKGALGMGNPEADAGV